MKNMFKYIVVLGSMLVAGVAIAASVTSHGITVDTQSGAETATDTADYTVIQDQSVYGQMLDRRGLIVARWTFNSLGGTNVGTGIDTTINIPTNSIIDPGGVIIDVTQAITPSTASNRIVLTYEDTTNIQYTIRPQAAGYSAGVTYTNLHLGLAKTTNSFSIMSYFAGSSATQGAWTVYIPYIKGN